MKRISLLVLVNLLVVFTIVLVTSVLGIGNYITQYGLDYGSLLAFSAVVGFVGSFISLAISRWMAKKMMGVKVIKPEGNLNIIESNLINQVYKLARSAGITVMPEVGIYNSPEVNAFATGPTKNKALVAVSSGLLQKIDQDALEGVLAHEIAHISNGDMVTMTLIQGVVNTFVVFLSRVVAFTVSRFVKEELSSIVHFLAIIVFQLLFGILGSFVVMAFSRKREYTADQGGADLAGKEKMIKALEQLKSNVRMVQTNQEAIQTLKINGGPGKVMKLLSSHPDLDDRINRLKA